VKTKDSRLHPVCNQPVVSRQLALLVLFVYRTQTILAPPPIKHL